MCGIAGIFDFAGSSEQKGRLIRLMLSQMEHRGDKEHAYEIKILPSCAFGCNRLSIVDRENAHQPLTNADETLFAIFNGEIYNYLDIRRELIECGYTFATHSDTEVLVHGYQEWGKKIVDHLDGMFAFVIYDKTENTFIAARDHIGIKPLYYVHNKMGYFFASEMRSLLSLDQNICTLHPGHILTREGAQEYFILPEQQTNDNCNEEQEMVTSFKNLFIAAVRKRVQTDLPIGVIFSGGIDSAVVLYIASHYHRDVTAFTVGFEGSADLEIAQRYCAEYGIRQQVAHLSMEDILRDLPQTIYHLESFESIDVSDASIMSPAFKLAREAGIKVVLCGDGSDELLAGYDFFKTSPDPDYLMRYRLGNLHRTDLQRVDRSSMRYRVEARVPFMDKDFLSYACNVPMSLKLRNGSEKWILREAFKKDLPAYIAQRPKVRMPDGSGLAYQLLDFARQQKVEINPELLENLHIDQMDGAYFLAQYIALGYPLPQERYKRAGLDFGPNGYFKFS